MFCCLGLHVVESENGQIKPISESSYLTIVERLKEWSQLDGKEKQISQEFLKIPSNCQGHDLVFSACTISTYCTLHVCAQDPIQIMCIIHRKCYSRFTDKTWVTAARVCVSKACLSDKESRHCDTDKHDDGDTLYEPKVPKRKRSLDPIPKVSENRAREIQRRGIFPKDECIICKKVQYKIHRPSGKRMNEPLSQCLTFNANNALHKGHPKSRPAPSRGLLC